VFFKPKGLILVGASARGYKLGNVIVRRACVTVAAEAESSVAIEALDAVDVNDDLADGLVGASSSSPIAKGSEFLGRLKNYSISLKSAVAEKLSVSSAGHEQSLESDDSGVVHNSELPRDGGNEASASDTQSSGNSLMSSMMNKALQAAALVASDYRGSSALSASSTASGSPASAEVLTSMMADAAHELRDVSTTSASCAITTQHYQRLTKLVRVRVAGVIPVHLLTRSHPHIQLLFARVLPPARSRICIFCI
jgi:hypothetical protein